MMRIAASAGRLTIALMPQGIGLRHLCRKTP
jgi:hypothetical protein